jgi:hypothetical protein
MEEVKEINILIDCDFYDTIEFLEKKGLSKENFFGCKINIKKYYPGIETQEDPFADKYENSEHHPGKEFKFDLCYLSAGKMHKYTEKSKVYNISKIKEFWSKPNGKIIIEGCHTCSDCDNDLQSQYSNLINEFVYHDGDPLARKIFVRNKIYSLIRERQE